MYRLAIYGKGGIGKSTTTCNLAAELARRGLRVMQIGCDPKADSTRLHAGERAVRTVLDVLREGGPLHLDDVVVRASDGVWCVEAGGPVPGIGCAGRGIVEAFDVLSRVRAWDEIAPHVVLYDVLGDVVCGGFAMPLRGEHSDEVMVVTSGEAMSLYAAGNILSAIESFKARGYARFAGLVANLRDAEGEREEIERFCGEMNASVVAWVPRSSEVQRAERVPEPVMRFAPDCGAARAYRALADDVERRAASAENERGRL